MDLVLLEELEGFFVSAPEGEEFDPVFLVLKDFLLELGNVLGSPVVGRPFQADLNQHLGPRFRRTLGCVERNDAPGHEVFPIEIFSLFSQKAGECKRKTQNKADHLHSFL